MFRLLKRLVRDLWLIGEHETVIGNGHIDHEPPSGSGLPLPRKDRHLDEIDREYYLQPGGEA